MGAMSRLDITADIYHGADISGLDIDSITRALGALTCTPCTPGSFEIEVERAVLEWHKTAAPMRRAYMAINGIIDIAFQLNEAIMTIVNRITTAHLAALGVPMPPDDDPPAPIQIGDTYDEAITATMAANPRVTRWAAKVGEQYQRTREAFAPYTDLTELINDHAHCQQVARGVRLREVQLARRHRQLEHHARHAINRGIRAFTKMLGARDIVAFISQGSVMIEGVRYNYHLTNRGNIVHHTMHLHGTIAPYGLTICDKQGARLIDGCVYIPHTPIIDQIMALALNVKDAESELEFLRNTNPTSVPWNEDGQALRDLMHQREIIRITTPPRAIEVWIDEANLAREPVEPDWRTLWEDTRREYMPLMWRSIEAQIRDISRVPPHMFNPYTNGAGWPVAFRAIREQRASVS
jgi:hypothetical protein